MKRATAARPAPGIRRTPYGWQAFIRILGPGNARAFRSKRFAVDTPLVDMKRWRTEQRARADLRLPTPARTYAASTLGDDVKHYLETVESMETYDDRKRHLERWRDALGADRPRAEITTADMNLVVERWKKDGFTRMVGGKPKRSDYGETTLNHYRTALVSLWVALDGKDAPNPARAIKRLRPDVKPLELPSIEDAARVIAAINRDDRKKYRDDAKERRDGRATRARLNVFLWTGWPWAQIKTLDKARLQREIKAGEVTVSRRRKGRGTSTVVMPLLPKAIDALNEFDAADAYGKFSDSSIWKSVRSACARVGVAPFNPYKLRHLFLTTMAEQTGDAIAVNFLGMHTTMKQTERYIERAKLTRARMAVASVGKLPVSGRRVASAKKQAHKRRKKTAF